MVSCEAFVSTIPRACLAPGVTPADLASFKIIRSVPPKDLISPEQAAYNVLKVYFDGTAAGPEFGATRRAAPFNYLQIYATDFIWAEAHVHAPAKVVKAGGATVSMSAQELLDLASKKVFEIAEPAAAP